MRGNPFRTALVVLMWTLGLGISLFNGEAQAHKVNVFAYVEGDTIIVEGYFSGSAKAQDSKVEVFDADGKKIHEGTTDKKGIYSFKLSDLPPFRGGLKIVLEAGMGHMAEYVLSASDLPATVTKESPPAEKPREDKSEDSATGAPVASSGAGAVVDQAALTAALEKVLDQKLGPLVKMLGRQERLLLEERHGGPRLTEIIGGIGWIMGLVGLAAFFWGRKR